MCYDSSVQRPTSALCGHGCCDSISSADVQLQRKCSDNELLLKLFGYVLSGCGSSSQHASKSGGPYVLDSPGVQQEDMLHVQA